MSRTSYTDRSMFQLDLRRSPWYTRTCVIIPAWIDRETSSVVTSGASSGSDELVRKLLFMLSSLVITKRRGTAGDNKHKRKPKKYTSARQQPKRDNERANEHFCSAAIEILRHASLKKPSIFCSLTISYSKKKRIAWALRNLSPFPAAL